MSNFPSGQPNIPVIIGDKYKGSYKIESVDIDDSTDPATETPTPVDVTGDDWEIVFRNDSNEEIFTMSTANGYLTFGVDTSKIYYEVPATDTEQFDPQNIRGMLRNVSQEQSIGEIQTQIIKSTSFE